MSTKFLASSSDPLLLVRVFDRSAEKPVSRKVSTSPILKVNGD
jgi:hypothetical protein